MFSKITEWGAEKILSGVFTIVKGVAVASYWPCVFICIGGVLFYIIGIKKGGKVATGSMLTYLLLQAAKLALM